MGEVVVKCSTGLGSIPAFANFKITFLSLLSVISWWVEGNQTRYHFSRLEQHDKSCLAIYKNMKVHARLMGEKKHNWPFRFLVDVVDMIATREYLLYRARKACF